MGSSETNLAPQPRIEATSNDSEPPHNREAEEAVLGATLLGEPLPSNLRAIHFYVQQHRLIYKAMIDLTERGGKPDIISTGGLLEEWGDLEAVGGVSYISDLTDKTPDVANVEHWAGIVRDCAGKRILRGIGHDLLNPNGKPTQEMANTALERLRLLSEGAHEGAPSGPVWRSLREYLDQPDLLHPPEEVVPNLAWRGRATLLAAREKAGKSTYAAFGAALLSRAPDGGVLWVNLEEAPFDVVNRFEGLNADPDRVIVSEYLPNRLTDLEAAITEHTPALVVIDTLCAWGAGRVTDWNAAAQVTPVMLELVELARRHNIALVIVHHGKKADGSYRDSTAIGASVDVIIEMSIDDKDDHVRHFKPKGRWTVEPFSLRWTGTTYEPADGELSVLDRVYRHIEQNPGCSHRAVRKVKGNNESIDDAIKRLIRDRRIEDLGDSNGAKYHPTIEGITPSGPCPDPPEMAINGAKDGHGRGTPSGAPEKPNGALDGHGRGTGQGTPPVPHPLKGGCGGTVVGAVCSGEEIQESNADIMDFESVVRDEVKKVPKAARPELPEHSRDWPKPIQKRLRELVAQGHRRIPATEIVRREYEEGP